MRNIGRRHGVPARTLTSSATHRAGATFAGDDAYIPGRSTVLGIVDRGEAQYIVELASGPHSFRIHQNFAQFAMRFTLVDRIVALEPGKKITAVKNLSLAEEYLADHFPGFPVLPGVLMLESMTQAAAWLVRVSEDFRHSMVVLKEARNVKYSKFVEPGQTLSVTAEWLDRSEQEVKFKAHGEVDGEQAVSARLTLATYNLAETDAGQALTDEVIRQKLREFHSLVDRGRIPA